MNNDGGAKVNGVRQIVRLREILQRWHSVTVSLRGGPPEQGRGISPAINKRLIRDSQVISESDEENGQSLGPPPDVPKGYLAVYVGPELRRFIIPTAYLGLPVFKVLLEKAEEEFGFDPNGALTLPCEIETFKYILQTMSNSQKGLEDNDRHPSEVDDSAGPAIKFSQS